MESEFIYVKDLRIFKNVNLKDMIIIDNSVLSFAFHLPNGIPILPFYDNKDDTELKFLSDYLNKIAKVNDLREENKSHIKMDYFLNKAKEEENENSVDKDKSIERDPSFDESNKESSLGGLISLNFCGVSNINSSNNIINKGNYNSNESDRSNNLDESIKEEENINKGNDFKFIRSNKKKNSVFQNQLFSTLDDLKKSFSKFAESK
jgi:CTD small phosphatase-like protein 2